MEYGADSNTGRLFVIGIGPGDRKRLTPEAAEALERSEVIVGYPLYLDLIQDLIAGKEIRSTPMRAEVERCRIALEIAASGRQTALVCSGDSGVYGMAGLCYELAAGSAVDGGGAAGSSVVGGVEITVLPGITAALSGAALLGSPIGNDFAVISLSDLLTPWDTIAARLDAAGRGDFSLCLYNPSSMKRKDHLRRACDILLKYRRAETICGITRNIGRGGEEKRLLTLGELAEQRLDMVTTVFIGNSATENIRGKMVVRRGYRHGTEETKPERREEAADSKKTRCLIFAGTSEGRALVEELRKSPLVGQLTVWSATEYGETMFAGAARQGAELVTRHGRLNADDMAGEIARTGCDYVIDATHPYAAEVTQNILAACEKTGAPYLRLSRNIRNAGDDPLARRFADAGKAAEFLRSVTGNILLTTGSKDLEAFADAGLRERVFPRILPAAESLARCAALGFPPARVIAMQGPFPEDLNRALLRHIGASWLVTKETGDAGGFAEKAAAALAEGAGLVVIDAPEKPAGRDLEGILDIVLGRKNAGTAAAASPSALPSASPGAIPPEQKTVYLVGMGPGSGALLTGEAREALAQAGAVLGAERLLRAHQGLIAGKPQKALIDPAAICAFIETSACRCAAVLLSGDSGFYSGAKRLFPLIQERGWKPVQLCGVSSVACFAAKLGLSWEDALLVSLHGRGRQGRDDITGRVLFNPKVFFLTDSQTDAAVICRTLAENGLGEILISAGERLAEPEERIRSGTAGELAKERFDPQSVVLAQNSAALSPAWGNYGFSDADFERSPAGEKTIPMTKGEIRAVAAAKLRVENDSVVWDIGAGTGAMSCDLALRARHGRVYAVEQDLRALALVTRNRNRLRLGNIAVIPGRAPAALAGLPAPDCVFIGGSGGDLRALVHAALAKNPAARIAATALTTETLAEMNALIRDGVLAETELIQIVVARASKAGDYHLFQAANPVFLLSGQNLIAQGERP